MSDTAVAYDPQTMTLCHSFPYSARADALVLILGSMPGEESLRQQQYYAHPRNVFWDIMGELFGAGRELPYADRLARLRQHYIALWDVAGSCRRNGSLDASIDLHSVAANDFATLFARCPSIALVFFNGRKAADLFERLVAPSLGERVRTLEFTVLPSTSPANASFSKARKLAAWRAVREALTR